MKNLKIFFQNIRKNNFIINTILKVNYNFNVIFIQKPSWTTIRSIPSSENCEGIPLVGVPNHPNWLTFARESNLANDSSRVIIYINIRLSSLWFSLYKDIISHKDILFVSFFNNNIKLWIINIYSDSSHSTLKYLKNSEANIQNLLICYNQYLKDVLWRRVKGNNDTIGCAVVISVSTSCSDNTIGCAIVISVSTLCSRCYILTSISCIMPYLYCVLQTLSLWASIIYRVDTALYLYALPIVSTLTSFPSLCLSYNLSQV